MVIKFTAKHMSEYQGVDGLGGMIVLKRGEEAEVSEIVANLLMQKYSGNFEIILREKPEHAPQADKLFRKGAKTKTK